jgi:acyl-coenzyme A thioesterase PaaI-like protein
MPIRLSPRAMKLTLNCWPPFLGAGIRVRDIAADWRRIIVEMRLGWTNRNAFGTHFGGSLYAMTDPFFALMVLHNLSAEYLVWDKAANIDFVAPGRGRVRAEFALADSDLESIRKMTSGGDKHLHVFKVDVVDEQRLVVARVDKVVYVRRRKEGGA